MRLKRLEPAKKRSLEAVPGWSWDPYADDWEDGFRQLREYAEEYGSACRPRPFVSPDCFRLGQWVTVQRVTMLKRGMDEERTRRLEELPNWAWDPRSDAWEKGFEHLVEFSREAGLARPPQTHVCSEVAPGWRTRGQAACAG